MKFYDLSRKERRKLKNQFDKTILGTNLKDATSMFIVISLLFLVSPFILCVIKGFSAISVTYMLTFLGFFLTFNGIIYIMIMIRYIFLKEYYNDRMKEKDKEEKDNKK